MRALSEEGYQKATPIQSQAIPPLLQGKDLIGIAQTGTGKTAAFAVPMLQILAQGRNSHAPRTVRALVLTPTRELAVQVDESVGNYGRHLGLKHTCIFGGVSDLAQKKALSHGVDVLTATPGRLLDLLNQGSLTLGALEFFVLDEADRMLDMGFIHDVRKIVTLLPYKRQTLLFSATMPADIAALARTLLHHPVRVEVTPAATTVDTIEQILYRVEKTQKLPLLRQILSQSQVQRALVFSRTKHGANKICDRLVRQGVAAAAIHGNKSQNRRQEALQGFKDGSIRVLVATDIAARGIDVDDVSHVINFDMPMEPETYVHRIGRTARAGASGHSISFCSHEEEVQLRQVERLIRRSIPLQDLPDLQNNSEEDVSADLRPPRPHKPNPTKTRVANPRQNQVQNDNSQKKRRSRHGADNKQPAGQNISQRQPRTPNHTTSHLSEEAWKGSAFSHPKPPGRSRRSHPSRTPRTTREPHSSSTSPASNGMQRAWNFVKKALKKN